MLCGLKLDISKAYDRIEWDFLKADMVKMRFDTKWIGIIMRCVATVTYFVIINVLPKILLSQLERLDRGSPIPLSLHHVF